MSIQQRYRFINVRNAPALMRSLLSQWKNDSCMGGFHGVMVSTLDSESSDPSSNLGGTCLNYEIYYFTHFLEFGLGKT